MQPGERLLNLKQLAYELGFNASYLSRVSRKFPCRHIGRKRLFFLSEVLEATKVEPTHEPEQLDPRQDVLHWQGNPRCAPGKI